LKAFLRNFNIYIANNKIISLSICEPHLPNYLNHHYLYHSLFALLPSCHAYSTHSIHSRNGYDLSQLNDNRATKIASENLFIFYTSYLSRSKLFHSLVTILAISLTFIPITQKNNYNSLLPGLFSYMLGFL